MSKIIHLSYISTGHFITDNTLQDIENTSSAFNSKVGVTGFLLFNGANFLQTLQGSEKTLTDLLARIKKDPRHYGVVVVQDHPIEAMTFPNWGMRVKRIARGGVGDATFAELRSMADPELKTMMDNFMAIGG
ncbi:MAG: BLUF domain-containing protein [Hyphomicrobiales bacterium]|nr:BLUF domain-containing protein [Hyphomicrobiales bacterium]